MSRTILVLLAMVATLCLAQVVFAAKNDAETARLARLTHALDLTADQQTKALAIFQQERQQVLAVLTPEQQAAREARAKTFSTEMKALNLTADQTAQIKAIRKAVRAQEKTLKADTTLTAADKKAQRLALRKDTHAKMLAVLTPDQQAEVEEAVTQAKADKELKNLKITNAQETQIHQIRETAKEAFRALLTTDQQAQFDALRTKKTPKTA